MRILILLTALALFGCASSTKTYLPNGGIGHSINCSGGALSWNLCYERAGEICKSTGYKVLEKAGDQYSNVTWNQYGMYGGSGNTRTLIIECNSSTSSTNTEPDSSKPDSGVRALILAKCIDIKTDLASGGGDNLSLALVMLNIPTNKQKDATQVIFDNTKFIDCSSDFVDAFMDSAVPGTKSLDK